MTDSTEIKAGAIVQLKSGGPKMTVSQVGKSQGKQSAWCDWFALDKAPWKQENGVFPVTSLKVLET